MIWLVPLIIVVGGVLIFIKIGNDLVVKKNRIDNAFSQIDVQLKRRFDLIPNLVETVKGSSNFEKETLLGIANARNLYKSATTVDQKIDASKQMDRAFSSFIAVSESYPELKSNSQYKDLMNELSKNEDKISFARQFYNDTVLLYNNAIAVFPGSIIADAKGLKQATYFSVDETERENVKVKFS